jgi:hypothetical protein
MLNSFCKDLPNKRMLSSNAADRPMRESRQTRSDARNKMQLGMQTVLKSGDAALLSTIHHRTVHVVVVVVVLSLRLPWS